MYKPVSIDPLVFAREKRELRLDLPLSELEDRVVSMLSSADGICHVQLNGLVDVRKRPVICLTLQANLRLKCQRCLGDMTFPLESQTNIVLYKDEESLNAALDEIDDLDALLIEPQLDLKKLVEDEIIMSLPFAPKHELCNNDNAQLNKHTEQKPNPFAMLAVLKKH